MAYIKFEKEDLTKLAYPLSGLMKLASLTERQLLDIFKNDYKVIDDCLMDFERKNKRKFYTYEAVEKLKRAHAELQSTN